MDNPYSDAPYMFWAELERTQFVIAFKFRVMCEWLQLGEPELIWCRRSNRVLEACIKRNKELLCNGYETSSAKYAGTSTPAKAHVEYADIADVEKSYVAPDGYDIHT